MVLDGQRTRFDFAITPVARKLINVNPNTISWVGLILALLCGVVFYLSGGADRKWMLVLGAVMVIVSGYLDALDGKVAKLSGKAGPKGDYLDHVFDRYADVFIISGIAFCAYWCDPYLGMLAIIGTLLTSYMGTQAQAIGAPRLYAGLLGRADRVVLSTIFPITQFIGCSMGYPEIIIEDFSISWLEVMMLWFAVAGNLTAIQRAIITWRNLRDGARRRPRQERVGLLPEAVYRDYMDSVSADVRMASDGDHRQERGRVLCLGIYQVPQSQ